MTQRRGERTGGLIRLRRSTANGIMTIVPIVAVILFFATSSWLWFFAIPIVSIVVFGTGERRGTRHENDGNGVGRAGG